MSECSTDVPIAWAVCAVSGSKWYVEGYKLQPHRERFPSKAQADQHKLQLQQEGWVATTTPVQCELETDPMTTARPIPVLAGQRATARRLREEMARLLRAAKQASDLLTNAELLYVVAQELCDMEEQIDSVLTWEQVEPIT